MICLTILFCIFWTCNEVFAFWKYDNKNKIIEIPKNSSTKDIADILKQNKIVQNTFLFSGYAKLCGAKLKYGIFDLNPAMSYGEIIETLSDDSKNKKVLSRLNFYEGSNFFSLREKYFNDKNFNFIELMSKLNDEDVYSKFDFFKMLDPADLEKAYFPMEGFCATDSFNVKYGYNSLNVANLIFSEFDETVKEFKEKIEKSKLNLWQTIILASIIQSETSKIEDMSKISSVLHNRLRLNENFNKNLKKRQFVPRRLECDSTTNYARKIKNSMEKSGVIDLKKVNSYDTYVCMGLPAGPICNPSKEAIEAAINPAETSYLYFCTDAAGLKTLFAKTFEEHCHNLKVLGLKRHSFN